MFDRCQVIRSVMRSWSRRPGHPIDPVVGLTATTGPPCLQGRIHASHRPGTGTTPGDSSRAFSDKSESGVSTSTYHQESLSLIITNHRGESEAQPNRLTPSGPFLPMAGTQQRRRHLGSCGTPHFCCLSLVSKRGRIDILLAPTAKSPKTHPSISKFTKDISISTRFCIS
jgi:hypothetical protein